MLLRVLGNRVASLSITDLFHFLKHHSSRCSRFIYFMVAYFLEVKTFVSKVLVVKCLVADVLYLSSFFPTNKNVSIKDKYLKILVKLDFLLVRGASHMEILNHIVVHT